MRLCFYLLALTCIRECVSEKRGNEGTTSMDQIKSKCSYLLYLDIVSVLEDGDDKGNVYLEGMSTNFTRLKCNAEFGNSFSTEKKTHSAERIHQKHSIYDKKLMSLLYNQQRDLVTDVPDLNDVCFRVYNKSIVINAQPYERQSNMQLEKCKERCMQSQTSIYTCRSFVYNVVNKICDFFAYQGNQLPAKLLKYYEHLYLEPTFANGCDLKYAKKSKKTNGKELSSTVLLSDTDQKTCEKGKVTKYLRTQGFKLDSANRRDVKGYNLDACSDACTSNVDDEEKTFECRSFHYSDSGCSLFEEVAVPRGTRELKKNPYTNYYEKICIDDDLMSGECQSVNRFPQMLLIGFAEVVVTTRSFIACFENCLKSRQLFGTNCTSAIYFYEELEQNCILNSENRQTQRNLFVRENIDIVDYFEVNCPLRKRKKVIDDLLFKS